MQFGLIFFSSDEKDLGAQKYQMVLESAKFADQHGFSGVWLPERHFTKLGCIFPNPAVLHAALAMITKQVRLRSGSVVLPLHNPLRIAEEWSVVDNLSEGRVEVSFASGWHPNDFALSPDTYSTRYEDMYQGMATIQKLWSRETISVTNGIGEQVSIRTYPTPVQAQLPMWVTAAGNPQTFAKAGELGCHLLTHLFDHSVEELAKKIMLYRQARADHGFDPGQGKVAVLLHTFLGEELSTVKEQVRGPFCGYLKSNKGLLKGLGKSRGMDLDLSTLTETDIDEFTNFLFERFSSTRALIGTPNSSAGLVHDLEDIGVDEIACLLDFGIAPALVLDHLPFLHQLQQQCLTRPPQRYGPMPHSPQATSSIITEPSPKESTPTAQEILPCSEPSPKSKDLSFLSKIQGRCDHMVTPEELIAHLEKYGITWGPRFRAIQSIWIGENEALAQLKLPHNIEEKADSFFLHPIIWDNSFLPLGQIATKSEKFSEFGKDLVPMHTGYRTIHAFKPGKEELWSHAILSHLDVSAKTIEGSIHIYDPDGNSIAHIEGLKYQLVDKHVFKEIISSSEREHTQCDCNASTPGQTSQPHMTTFRQSLLDIDPSERPHRISQRVSQITEKVLSTPFLKLDPNVSLVLQGLESLRAIDLRNRVQAEIGVTVSLVWLLKGVSLIELTQQVLALFQVTESEEPSTEETPSCEERLIL